MRPPARLGVVAVATAAFVAVAAPAFAAVPPPVSLNCSASVSMDYALSGQFSATVTATVYGYCAEAAWTTCDITMSGAPGLYGTAREAGWNWCESTITFVGLQNTPYVGVGRVGYSAVDYPIAAAVGAAVPRA
ncbi:MAG TPA: hypothetical protein VF519_14900 [Mycobacteriales bacterium]|jgi:hypothetical protein